MKRDGIVPDSRTALLRLAEFHDRFAAPGATFGDWHRPEPVDGTAFFPGFAYSDLATSFVEMCNDEGWVLWGFPWSDWTGTAEARQLLDDPGRLQDASREQLARLLTACIRQARFAEGALAEHYASGLLPRITERARTLLAEEDARPAR